MMTGRRRRRLDSMTNFRNWNESDELTLEHSPHLSPSHADKIRFICFREPHKRAK